MQQVEQSYKYISMLLQCKGCIVVYTVQWLLYKKKTQNRKIIKNEAQVLFGALW